ncbi:MAG: ATP-dependent zinc metalloprotease FtsH [Finegoldia magna]|uniref:ATP-dependent zinc metalloprotease FtsH n=1 Tax=Finegoldia magna TaxID=1260 RepID=A0A7D4JMX0_FINMA|nr:ATP-dependent zinc metalloprotease FtsH [Finegoldia magna]EGS32526.1 ATP-dependent metallopeptidase HflB [Finegoldia magna SY403409CC001050417]MBS6927495.1 ATP-dependent zinc metalloprotease FtsH [Finegoldia magna]MDU5272330.1 ATP-dependent zinc metalloprotease FtsH [Finegoldia magna]MDU5807881.1 ATP-dependent zinc metalloprotease FtsH [Finegoldia magna]MDU7166010.1 ATP-dependent zinc metalloprotease FtsH [Finegoldia magna]
MKKVTKSLAIYLVPIILIAFFVTMTQNNTLSTKYFTVNEMIVNVKKDNVKEIVAKGNDIKGVLKDSKATPFKMYMPSEMWEVFYNNYLKESVENNKIVLKTEKDPGKPWYMDMMPTILIIVGLGIIWFMFMNQTQNSGNSKAMNFGKSKAKLNQDSKEKVVFADVAGLKEEKEELMEIVDFLKNPSKYIDIGARIPKGVLLVGPPGTGKTYLSRAVAGEAKVPFFSISGSDFVEMFVGVGASRVRDLFEQAKKNAPCIIFIDEIDAVGRKRGAGLGGGHDEREQTLNQLLVEMDGFGKNEGVIVMSATNRPDILDKALLRPGRFDRTIYVGLPDVRERLEILKVHTKNKKLKSDVDLADIAKTTTGFSPADLENLCNEAALLAARNNEAEISNDVFKEASIKVVAGPEKKSQVVIEKERVLTAYHESGHAIVSGFLEDNDKVHMITIIPRGRAGGFTAYLPQEDAKFMTKRQMQHKLISLLGGRAAEEVVLDDISTGASNDIERATKIAHAMVTKYGMSKRLGPMMYGGDDAEVFLGEELGKNKQYSDKIAYEIDSEMRELIDEAYNKALNILNENIDLLHALANKLLEKETIGQEEFEAIFDKYTQTKIHENEPKELVDVRKKDEEIEKNIDNQEK